MKVCFISNFFNHHQLDFCEEMYRNLKSDFTFIQTDLIPEFRVNLGYRDLSDGKKYIVNYIGNEKNAKKIISDANIIINTQMLGTRYLKYNKKSDTVVFWYMERIFKDPSVKFIKNCAKFLVYKTWLSTKRKQYFLCASSYCKHDLMLLSKKLSINCLKWGYFPHIDWSKKHRFFDDNIVRFLFVGRLISWKHPEMCLIAANYLRSKNVPFEINIIGDGKMKNKLTEMIAKDNLEQYVRLLGAMQNDQLSDMYAKTDCLLFTSGREEGWGAVLNEGMAYGCIPIASSEAGSTKYLLSHYNVGYTYSDLGQFYKCLDMVVGGKRANLLPEKSTSIRIVIANHWNGTIAANRFLDLCYKINSGDSHFSENNELGSLC